jgi:phytoene synthase
VPLTSNGFALPCFRKSLRPNIWYLATCSVPGDHQGTIEAFEPFSSDDIQPISRRRVQDLKVGDPWHDVFLYNSVYFIGRPKELWKKIDPIRDAIRHEAPLSLLDLAIAADTVEQNQLAANAFSYLEKRFGPEKARTWRRDILVRQSVILGFRRVIVMHQIPISLDHARDLEIDELSDGSYEVRLPDQMLEISGPIAGFVSNQLQALGTPLGFKLRLPANSGAASFLPPKQIPPNTQPPHVENLSQGASSGSSFYAAMRILPPDQRDAMFAIYSFCRQVDDIADSLESSEVRLQKLREWRTHVNGWFDGDRSPKNAEYLPSIKQFDLRQEDFLAIIDGMMMDAQEDIRAPDLATLLLYCDRVASAVGRLSVRVFGLEESDGLELAHHLGQALQLTNILRDIDEDASIGRLYLPKEMLQGAGIESLSLQRVLADKRLPEVCFPIAAIAKSHFEAAGAVMDRCPRRLVRAPRIMAKYYSEMLRLLVERGFDMPRLPVRLSKLKRISILLRYAFF